MPSLAAVPVPFTAFDAVEAHVCALDAHGTVIAVNQAWRTFAAANGMQPDVQHEGMNYLAEVDAAIGRGDRDAPRIRVALAGLLDGTRTSWQEEYPCHAPHADRWFRVRATRVEGAGRIRVLVAHEDVTAVRRLSERLASVDTRHKALLAAMNDGVFVAEQERFVYGNRGFAAMLGRDESELAGLAFAAVIDPDYLERWTERFRARVNAEAPEPPRDYELRMLRRDGTPIWVDLHAARVILDGRPCVMGIVHDATSRREREATLRALEVQLRESRKIEAMGRLANAVAHDFNNLLTVVRSSIELARQDLAQGLPAQVDLDAALEGVTKAAQLTVPLLAFGHHQHTALETVRVERLLREMRDLLAPTLGPQHRLALETAALPATAAVIADPSHLREVLRHLVRNAADAMPDGGVIQLGASAELVTEPIRHRFGTVDAGRYVVWTVRDGGAGMTDEVLDRLFEPFFTTKTGGKGHGVGLAVVWGVVRQAGGSVMVETAPGHGTTITLWWPAATAAVEPTPPAVRRQPRPPAPEADLLLLVDDEPAVRRTTRRMLERLGCRVLDAADGHEALGLAERHAAELRAVISDVRMPGLTGPAFVERLRTLGLDRPVLFISGQLEVPLPHAVPDGYVQRFLHKPFTMQELAAEVAQLLGRPADGAGAAK